MIKVMETINTIMYMFGVCLAIHVNENDNLCCFGVLPIDCPIFVRLICFQFMLSNNLFTNSNSSTRLFTLVFFMQIANVVFWSKNKEQLNVSNDLDLIYSF